MAQRFWVGGDGTWDSSSSAKWSATSNGAGGVSVPTAADDVFFNGASGNHTINLSATSVCRSFNCNAFPGTIIHPGAVTFAIGDGTEGASNIAIKLSTSMTYTLSNTATSAIHFASTAPGQQTIDFGGKSTGNVTFDTAGNYKYLSDHTTASLSGLILYTAGTLSTNGFTMNWGRLSSPSGTRTLSFGASVINILGTGVNYNLGLGVTFDAGTSTLNIVDTTSATKDVRLGTGITYNVVVVPSGGTGIVILNSGPTINTLVLNGPKTIQRQLNTLTVNNLVLNSSIGNVLTMTSTVPGSQGTIAKPGGRINADYLNLTDIAISCNELAYAGRHSVDGGNNTGIVFTDPPSAPFSEGPFF